MTDYDVAIIGGGCVGLATAKALLEETDLSVAVLEKESTVGAHQSGRNSGVLHPGFNYRPGSLKAEYAVAGTARLKQFAADHSVPLDELGVLVVATSARDVQNLEVLFERASANEVTVERLHNHDEIAEKEPHAVGQIGLWCPEAASIDPQAYVAELGSVVGDLGGDIHLDTTVSQLRTADNSISMQTDNGEIVAAHLVNAAGFYADRFAHQLGVGLDHRIVPFRGEYYTLEPSKRHLTRSMIYPTPDPDIPFLGVHFTRRTDGSVIVGPNAVIAPGREAYRNTDPNLRELAELITDPAVWRILADGTRRRIALHHLHTSIRKTAFVNAAQQLVPSVKASDLRKGHAGIRAQLVSDDGTLIMDPRIESGARSTHVLNAVSPGLTTSLPFGEHVASRVLESLEGG